MKEKTYLRLIQLGIVASLFFVFFVFKGMLFPYITSKQFSFNILMELLFALWLIFILKFPNYRLKKCLITAGLLSYFVAILMSLAVSVDFNLSFWGDAERMLGFFHVIHFFLFFLMLISVFRSWEDFKVLFMSSVLVATVVSLIGLFGENTFSTIGNTAYVSGYLIFNLFFAGILMIREKTKIRFAYLIPIVIMLFEFWACRTSGAIIGLFISLLLLVFLFGLLHEKKSIKRLAIIVFSVAIVGVIALFSQYKQPWFQSSFLKNLTPQKVTFQTRLISWKAAAQDFSSHPIFGTGFGNYAIIFDKHFDSSFFNYTTSETYFDRAHNNIIDITSTTGLVGLISYLSIFIFALIYLYRELKANGFKAGISNIHQQKNLEIIVIVSLIAAYFIQNLAIFDSYVTYMGLMITLGFVYFLRAERAKMNDTGEKNYRFVIKKQSVEIFLLIVFLLIAYVFAVNTNIKPKRMMEGAIQGYSVALQGDLDKGYQIFQDSLYGHPLERDARVMVTNLFTSYWDKFKLINPERAEEIINYTISLAEANSAFNPEDSLMLMQLSQGADSASRFYGNDDIEKANLYSALSLDAIDRAIEASPGRAPVYFVKAQILLSRGENDEAIATINQGIALNPNYYEGYCRLAQFDMYLQIKDGLIDSIRSCVDLGGASSINSGQFLIDSVSLLIDDNDMERAIIFAKRLVDIYPDDANVYLNLAKLYLLDGDNDSSAVYLKQAYELDKNISTEWNDFLDFVLINEEVE